MPNPLRLQIASGLAIHSIQKGNFSDILKPAARDLILAGDCLKAGDPVNNKFSKYLLQNWSRVFYIDGISERMGYDPVLENYYQRLVVIRSPNEFTLGRIPSGHLVNLISTPLIPWEVDATRQNHIGFLRSIVKQNTMSYKYIVAAAGVVPKDISAPLIVQGIAERNQFDPSAGAVTNSRTNPNGTRRRSYRPDFVLELK